MSLSFISCETYDNGSSDTNLEDQVIVEAHIDNQNSTRAVKLTGSTLSTFGMYAFYSGATRASNVSYTKNGTTWSGNKPVIWPAGAMDFYAISPNYNISTTSLLKSMRATSQYITYTVPTNTADQIDIMYSSILQLSKTDNNGKIIFSFRPGMHYFSFTAQNVLGTGYQVFAKKIIIHNIVQNGTFTFGQTNNTGDWTAESGETAVYDNNVMEFKDPIEITSSKVNLTNDEYFILIPQKITKWATSNTTPIPISTADADKNWYVEIVGQIIKTNDDGTKTYLLGNPDDTTDPEHPQYESVYFPLIGKSCKIGLGSTWNINFNGGYNKNGETYIDHSDRGDGGIIIKVAEWFPSSFDVEEWTPYYEDIEL